MTVYLLAAHGGHFYNCENGHTFVIGDVRKPTASILQNPEN